MYIKRHKNRRIKARPEFARSINHAIERKGTRYPNNLKGNHTRIILRRKTSKKALAYAGDVTDERIRDFVIIDTF